MDNWNRFDFGLVVMSIVGTVVDFLGEGIMPIPPGVLRIMRIFKLVFRFVRILGRCVRLFRFLLERSEAKASGTRRVRSSEAHKRMLEMMQGGHQNESLVDVDVEQVKTTEIENHLEALRKEQDKLVEKNLALDEVEKDVNSLPRDVYSWAMGCCMGCILGAGLGISLWLIAEEWRTEGGES